MARIDSTIEKGLRYLVSLRRQDGGFPAVKASDQSGTWTTGEAIGVICRMKSDLDVEWLEPTMLYVLNSQYPEGCWHLIAGAPGSTMSTADALMALLQIRNRDLAPPSLDSRIDRAITLGFKWLEICQNNEDGGWGIEYKPFHEEGKSRIFSTCYALRALCAREEDSNSAIEKGLNYILSTQNRDDGGWGFENGGESNLSSTARAVQLLVHSGQFNVDSPPVAQGLRYISQHQDHSPGGCVPEELITKATGLLRIDNYTPYDLLRTLLACKYPSIKVLQLVKWFEDAQEDDGRWHLRCQCGDKTWDACTWVTSESLLVLAGAKEIFESDPDFVLRCLLSSFPSLVAQDTAIEGLAERNFASYEKLFDLTPQIVIQALSDIPVNRQLIEAIFETFECINIHGSEEDRTRIAASWLAIADENDELEVKAKAFSFAGQLQTDHNQSQRLRAKGQLLEAMLDVRKAQIDTETVEKLREAQALARDPEDMRVVQTLLTFTNDFQTFQRQSDPLIAAIQGSNALLTLRAMEQQFGELPSVSSLATHDFFGRLEQHIHTELTSISEKIKSVVVSEVTGTFEEGQVSTLTCVVRSLGLPVSDVIVTLDASEDILVSENRREVPTIGTGGAELLFTITPRRGGRLRVPLSISYRDFSGERHDSRTEHEIVAQKSSMPPVEVAFKEIANPYSYGPGIFSPEMFYGREEKLREMVNSIQFTSQPYAVVGQRRIGKSAFLQALKLRLEEQGIISLIIDLEMIGPRKPTVLLDRLCEDVLLALSESPLKEKIPRTRLLEQVKEALSIVKEIEVLRAFKIALDRPETEHEQPAFRPAETIMKVHNSILEENGYKCVVMLDEIGELAEYEDIDMLLGFLRGLVQTLSQFVFVVAGPDVLFELTSYDRPFFNLFEKVHLRGLEEDDAKKLMTEPVPQVDHEEDVLSFVCQMTGGNPFYIQAVCKSTVALLNREKRYRVTKADIRSVVDILVDELDDHSRFQWKDTTTYEHLILASIASFEGLCDSTQVIDRVGDALKAQLGSAYLPPELTGAFQRLVEKGYIVKKGTNYRFSDEIFRRWVDLHHPLTDVAKEEFRLHNENRIIASSGSDSPDEQVV